MGKVNMKVLLDRFGNTNLAKRMIIGFSLIIILAVSTLGLSFINISRFEKVNELNLHSRSVLDDLENIHVAILNMETGQRGYVLTGNKQSLKPFTSGKDLVYKSIANARTSTIDNQEQQAILIQVEEAVDIWIAKANKTVENREMVETGYFSFDELILAEKDSVNDDTMGSINRMLLDIETIEHSYLEERSIEASRMMTVTKSAIIVGTISMILIAVAISIFIIASITKPIKEIVNILGVVASGDFSLKVSSKLTSKKDEIGQLATALDTMLVDLSALILRITDISNDVKASAEVVERVSGETKTTSEEVSKSIEEVTYDIQKQVDASNHIMSRTDNLTSNIDSSTAIINETISSSMKAKELSVQGQDIMTELNFKTNQNSTKSNDVNNAIIEVNKYANSAQSIISIIENISSQTNLLALNASIEAARAGDAGRGFAVVADEIRKLAEDTLKATGNINDLIVNIQSKSDHAVLMVSEVIGLVEDQNSAIGETTKIFTHTGDVINELVHKIDEVNQNAMNISESKDEIMASVEVITSLSEDNSAATEEIAASSEEQLAAMEELYNLSQKSKSVADELLELIQVFKI